MTVVGTVTRGKSQGKSERKNELTDIKLKRAIPVLPQPDVRKAAEFYLTKMGFETLFIHGEDYAGVGRDDIELHFYKCTDKKIAENTSCRIDVRRVEDLYGEFGPSGVIHPNGLLEKKPWGITEFSILDEAGVCITFGEEV